MSRHADGGRSYVIPIVAVAALAAIAALTVSVLALRHNSSSSTTQPLVAARTVYSTVTVGPTADPSGAGSNSSGPASSSGAPTTVSEPSGPTATNPSPSVPALSSGVGAISVYVVQPGDNLTRIAQRLHEDTQALYTANVKTIGVNADLIFPGERLILALPS